MSLTLLDRIKAKAEQAVNSVGNALSNPVVPQNSFDVFSPQNTIKTGQILKDVVSGFLSRLGNESNKLSGSQYNPSTGQWDNVGVGNVSNYAPQNGAQNFGSSAVPFAQDLVAGQNGGINDAFEQGVKTVSQIVKPKILSTVDNWFHPTEAPVAPAAEAVPQAASQVTPDILAPKSGTRKTVEAIFGGKDIGGTKGIIKNSGPAGQEIGTLLDSADKMSSHLSGQATDLLEKAIKPLKGSEIDTFADVVEGRLAPVSDMQAAAVDAWKAVADDVAKQAQAAGIEMGNIENYFPHNTIETGTPSTGGTLGRNAPRRYGNLELTREANAEFNKSPNVLFDYVKNAYGRIADAAHFGLNDEKLYDLAKNTRDPEQVVQYVDQILGKNQPPTSKVATALQSAQTVTKLNPATSITNLTQNLSTMFRTDIPTVVKTVGNIIRDPELAFSNATRVGEISPEMSKQLADYAGSSNIVGKWIRLIGMEGTEKFNRVVAVNSGMEYASKLAADGGEAALRELQRLGIGPDDIVNGALPEDKLLEAGRQISRATQFSTKAGDLPFGWKTNWGKVITQFKSFAYKQTGFIKNEAGRVASETAQGNVKPLVNALATVGVPVEIAGEIVNDLKSVIKNKKRTDTGSLVERYLSNIAAATSFGLIDSLPSLTGQYGENGVVSAVGGPTASDAQKIVSGVSDVSSAIQGNNVDLKPVARNLLKEIPGVGQTVSNTVVPNSFVENYIGPNNGLTEKDKSTYNNLKATDPTAAETFKQGNKAADKPQETTNVFEKLFGKKKEFDWKAKPTSKKAKTEYNSQVDTAIENDAKLPDEAYVNRFFNGKTFDQGDNASKEKVMQSALTVLNDEFMTDEQKSKALNAAKIDSGSMDYYRLASQNEDDKTKSVLEFVSSANLPHDQLLTALALNKRRVAGRSISTTGMVDELYDKGLISKADKAFITALKFDSVYNKFYMDRDYKGGGGMSDAQKKAYITKVNALFKTSTSDNSFKPKKTSFKSITTATPKKTNLTISKKKNAWFTA